MGEENYGVQLSTTRQIGKCKHTGTQKIRNKYIEKKYEIIKRKQHWFNNTLIGLPSLIMTV